MMTHTRGFTANIPMRGECRVARMTIYALGDSEPDIDPSAYIHPDAVVIGRVTIGAESSVWPSAVLRGDDGAIRIGDRTSVQDGTVVHATSELDTVVGSGCVIGHMVHLEGCVIEDHALVGNGSIVLHEAVVRSHALVGSNAVVPNGFEVPTGAMALGVPAKLREGKVSVGEFAPLVEIYVERGRAYRNGLRAIG
jgi:carbonic anhydrase/acetyltransferase-like protein (isoleucine patch superfamily)